ncbi:MAG: DUF934 domain-containing protein [Methylococcaceae bacterium]|nr:DUF934 domain-containing protein [Methylococcaceae bacterium]
MQIIKDNQLTENTWAYLADDMEIADGDATVSTSRLKQHSQTLLNRKGKLGVRLTPEDSVSDIAELLPKLSLIELHFPELADGRLFSQAWLLRNRYHFSGEIRATGHFLPDQVFYLSRVGVDSFATEDQARLSSTLAGLKDFSVNYQPSVN